MILTNVSNVCAKYLIYSWQNKILTVYLHKLLNIIFVINFKQSLYKYDMLFYIIFILHLYHNKKSTVSNV